MWRVLREQSSTSTDSPDAHRSPYAKDPGYLNTNFSCLLEVVFYCKKKAIRANGNKQEAVHSILVLLPVSAFVHLKQVLLSNQCTKKAVTAAVSTTKMVNLKPVA